MYSYTYCIVHAKHEIGCVIFLSESTCSSRCSPYALVDESSDAQTITNTFW